MSAPASAPALPTAAPPAVPAPAAALPNAAPVAVAVDAPAAAPAPAPLAPQATVSYIIIKDEESSLLSVVDQKFANIADNDVAEFMNLVDFFLECDCKVAHDSMRIKWVIRMVTLWVKQKYESSANVPVDFASTLKNLEFYIKWAESKIPAPAPEKPASKCVPW